MSERTSKRDGLPNTISNRRWWGGGWDVERKRYKKKRMCWCGEKEKVLKSWGQSVHAFQLQERKSWRPEVIEVKSQQSMFDIIVINTENRIYISVDYYLFASVCNIPVSSRGMLDERGCQTRGAPSLWLYGKSAPKWFLPEGLSKSHGENTNKFCLWVWLQMSLKVFCRS